MALLLAEKAVAFVEQANEVWTAGHVKVPLTRALGWYSNESSVSIALIKNKIVTHVDSDEADE